VSRIEAVFGELGEKPGRKTCAAREGLVEEGSEIIEEEAPPEVLDAGLIAAAQRVEHYEIAAYGTLRSLAKLMGQENAAALLEITLKEERETDQLLTDLAEGEINAQALTAVEGDGKSKPRRKAARRSRT
jgi:ferritin-like metal-binding protein YciE